MEISYPYRIIIISKLTWDKTNSQYELLTSDLTRTALLPGYIAKTITKLSYKSCEVNLP